MYDIIKNIINHVWDTTAGASSSEQQYLFFISGAVIIILVVWVLDALSRFIINIGRKGAK